MRGQEPLRDAAAHAQPQSVRKQQRDLWQLPLTANGGKQGNTRPTLCSRQERPHAPSNGHAAHSTALRRATSCAETFTADNFGKRLKTCLHHQTPQFVVPSGFTDLS